MVLSIKRRKRRTPMPPLHAPAKGRRRRKKRVGILPTPIGLRKRKKLRRRK